MTVLDRMSHPLAILLMTAVVAAACGIALQPQVLVLSAAALVTAGIGVVWPWMSLLGLRGTLTFHRTRAREGETIGAQLDVTNRAWMAAWGVAVQTDQDPKAKASVETSPSDEGLSMVGPSTSLEVEWKVVASRRGPLPAPDRPGLLTTGFPFGLFEARRTLAVPEPALVWPRTFPLGPLPDLIGAAEEDGMTHRDVPGDGGDLLGVRPYRRGDSLRRIHWAQTARYDRLMICERQRCAAIRVQIVIDTLRDHHGGDGPSGSREWAFRIAGSLVEALLAQGAEVELVVDDQHVVGRGGTVTAKHRVLFDALARCGADAGVGIVEVLDHPGITRFTHGLRIVIGTDRSLDALAIRARTRGLATLTERHITLDARAFDKIGVVGADRDGSGRHLDPSGDRGVLRPWILIDDPQNIEEPLRRRWREGLRLG